MNLKKSFENILSFLRVALLLTDLRLTFLSKIQFQNYEKLNMEC